MARKKKQRRRAWGTGGAQVRDGVTILRWRERVIQEDGTIKTVQKSKSVRDSSKTEINDMLRERLAATPQPAAPRLMFEEFAASWKTLILPQYPKHSTRRGHGMILQSKVLPYFRGMALTEITGEHIQQFVAALEAQGSAPHSIHDYHKVLSTILTTAVKWEKIPRNPALGTRLPVKKPVRKQEVLTYEQARLLLEKLPARPRVACAIALMTGARRGELFALRWKHYDADAGTIVIEEAVVDGVFDTPKTAGSLRTIPVPSKLIHLLNEWRFATKRNQPADFILSGRDGGCGNQGRMLRHYVKPAGREIGIQSLTWITFRRTWNTWADEKGISPKIRGEFVGNSAEVNSRIYTKVIPDTLRNAVNVIGNELWIN